MDFFKRTCYKCNQFWKEKKVTNNKKELQLRQYYYIQYVCYICGKRLSKKFSDDKKYQNVSKHSYFIGKYKGATHSTCNLRFNVSKEIPVIFHNSSSYDYHFIIKELANKFERQLEWRKYSKVQNCFHSNRKGVTKNNKDGNESVVAISYKIKFIDRARFMATSL